MKWICDYVYAKHMLFSLRYTSIDEKYLSQLHIPVYSLYNNFDVLQTVKKDLPRALNKTQSWSAVVSYVDTITSGVKDDDDPRFKRVEILAKEPADCFPKTLFNKWAHAD